MRKITGLLLILFFFSIPITTSAESIMDLFEERSDVPAGDDEEEAPELATETIKSISNCYWLKKLFYYY